MSVRLSSVNSYFNFLIVFEDTACDSIHSQFEILKCVFEFLTIRLKVDR